MCKAKKMGYIKLHRSLTEWGWYDDPHTLTLWIHLLLEANWKDGEWHGEEVKRGQMITSVAKLSAETNLSTKQIRICLDRLENGGEIKKEGTNKWTKITICKYDVYQSDDDDEGQANGEQTANEGQTKGKQTATIEESKKERREEIKKDIDVNNESVAAAERIYKLYPSSVIRKDGNRVSLKSTKDKDKIQRLLKSRSEEELTSIIKQYLGENPGAYTKMFSTFLNNLPDYGEQIFQPQPADWLVEGESYYASAFIGHEEVLNSLGFELVRHVKRNNGALVWKNGKFIIAK